MSPIEDTTSPSARRRVAVAAAFAAAACLGGCVSPKPAPAPAPAPVIVMPTVHCEPAVEPQDMAARHLLATQDRLAALNTADLAAEANRVIDPSSVDAAMDQALALSMTRAPGDLARAQGLLDQVLRNNASQADPWRAAARLLAYRLGEQRRAEDQLERSNQQLRDTQRDAQHKLDQLNDKLEALKAIERSLNTRSAAPGAR